MILVQCPLIQEFRERPGLNRTSPELSTGFLEKAGKTCPAAKEPDPVCPALRSSLHGLLSPFLRISVVSLGPVIRKSEHGDVIKLLGLSREIADILP